MRIETKWLSDSESCLAIPMLIKAKEKSEEIANDVMSLFRIDKFKNGYEIMDFINSVDDGYFADEYNPYQEERDKYAKEIEEFMNDNYMSHYVFFIKDYFCGLIKI
jgi:hypothetical protein